MPVEAQGCGSRRLWDPAQLPKIRALAVLSYLIARGRPMSLMRELAADSDQAGPWQLEADGIRITI